MDAQGVTCDGPYSPNRATQYVEPSRTRFAYRRLRKPGTVPLDFNQHYPERFVKHASLVLAPRSTAR
jgi:hypothetical protein